MYSLEVAPFASGWYAYRADLYAAAQGKGPRPKGPRPAPYAEWHAIYGLSNFAAYCIMMGEIDKKRQAMRDGNPP